jgi:cytochrome c-550 PedF
MTVGNQYIWAILIGAAVAIPSTVNAHGDVTPQAIDTTALPDIGEEWLEENPWRAPDGDSWTTAIEIGASGYNSNCARCHGLGAVSGGLAPDLRYLEADIDGDEWYLERFQLGMTQNGITKMPAFGELLGQKAAWAIRTYLETRPDDGALDDHLSALNEIKDTLIVNADMVSSGAKTDADFATQSDDVKVKLNEIAAIAETGSGAPMADSVASRAAMVLDGSDGSLKKAVDILKVGLSVAQ